MNNVGKIMLSQLSKLSLIPAVLVVTVFTSPAYSQDGYEVDDSAAEANIIVPDEADPQYHTIHQADDVDWVKFYALPDRWYEIKAFKLNSSMDAYVELYKPDGQTLEAPRKNNPSDPNVDELLSWYCTAGGIYYVKIGHASPQSYTVGAEYYLKIYDPNLIGLPVNFLRGTVVNNFNHVVSGASIVLSGVQGSGAGISSGSGTFVASAKTGTYSVNVSASGHNGWDGGATVPGNITVVLNRFNNAPVAAQDKFSVRRGGTVTGNVLLNDTDGDNDPLFAVLDSNVSNGTLQLNSNGSFTYTHDGQGGEDSFTYHATDTVANSSTVTVTVSLNFQQSMPFLMLLLNQP